MTNPPLRKRSEIGKRKAEQPPPPPQQEETFEAFEEEDPRGAFVELGDAIPEPKKREPVLGAQTDENISAFTQELQKQGFAVKLTETAGWGTDARAEVREWLKTMDATVVPEVLAPYLYAARVIPRTKPELGTPPEVAKKVPLTTDPTEPVVKAVPVPPPSRPAREPVRSISDDFNRLVETVLKELDLDSEYNELEGFLEIGDNRRDYATINEHLDKADRRALRANALWANAVIVYEQLKLDQEEVNASLWKEAKAELESVPEEEEEEEEASEPEEGKKKRKKRKAARKPITNQDVDAKIAELYPDEWRGGRMRLKRAEIAVARCEAFTKRWSERARSLQVMLGACRK